jgi:phosphatidylinositol alpha-mannosyltransferase
MPEVLGTCGELFDPRDIEAGVRALVAMLEDPTRRADLRVRGRERAQLFTWEKTGRTTLEAYRLAGEILATERGLSKGSTGASTAVKQAVPGRGIV